MERIWTRYAALGDSITEGWCDPVVPDGEPWFGWADRLALAIDAHVRRLGGPRLEFANLAVRGRRVEHVVRDQIPAALDMRADLVSILVGGNDLLALRADPDELAARLEHGIARLRAAGVDVLLATMFDRGKGLLEPLRNRTAVFNADLASIAQRHGCILLDAWGLPELARPAAWSEDLIHPSSYGHLALARAGARALGLGSLPHDPDEEAPAASRLPFPLWARRHLLPWVARRIRRVSSGDGRGPKIPEPRPVSSRRA